MKPIRIDLAARTLVKVKLLEDVSSAANRPGDAFSFAVAENVVQDEAVALVEGTVGRGRITRIKPPANMGRDAQITLIFGPVRALDGTLVRLEAGEESIAANKSQQLTVRVTAAGMIILGPAGILSGLFVRGKETHLPSGTEFFVQTAGVNSLYTLAQGER